MRYSNFNKESVQEVSEEDLSDIEESPELQIVNSIWCCAVIIGFIIGIIALAQNEGHFEEFPFAIFFTVFFIFVEIASALLSLIVLSLWCCCMKCYGRPPVCTDYVGIFSVCTLTFSHIVHMSALIIGPIIIVNEIELPYMFYTFIGYEIFLALIFTVWTLKQCLTREDFKGKSVIRFPEEELRRAEYEIQMARSHSSSLDPQVNFGQDAVQNREIRSTSSYDKPSSAIGEFMRQRSVSEYPKSRLKLPKLKIVPDGGTINLKESSSKNES